MADLLKMSTDIIDGNIGPDDAGPMNRINFQLSEVADGVAMVEAFSHCVLFESDAGLIAFDTSSPQGAGRRELGPQLVRHVSGSSKFESRRLQSEPS